MTNRHTPRTPRLLIAGLALMIGTLATGCIPPTISAAASGAAKLAAGNASSLTGSEIRALVEVANAAVPELELEVNAEQADAIAQFLSDNNINTQEDFVDLIDGITSGQTTLDIDPALVAVFVQEFEPETSPGLNNQGGGSLTTGLTKVINSDLTELTPDEVQILGQSLGDLDIGGPQQSVKLNDAQAAAIVEFVQINNLNTVADFEALDPDTAEIPEGAEELFEGL